MIMYYELNDLHKNMRVRVSQLSGILDVCMILLDTELLADGDVEGTLVYFGSGSTRRCMTNRLMRKYKERQGGL